MLFLNSMLPGKQDMFILLAIIASSTHHLGYTCRMHTISIGVPFTPYNFINCLLIAFLGGF